MHNDLNINDINQEPIENILAVLKAQGLLDYEGNRLLLDGQYSAKYRYSVKHNQVTAFNIDMPSGKPFNLVKSLVFSDLDKKKAIAETYNWYRGYYGIENSYSDGLQMNTKLMAEIKKNAEISKLKAEKEQKLLLTRRSTFPVKFKKLKQFYSDNTLDYFESRCISKETLKQNEASIGSIFHNNKLHKNRIFFPMKNAEENIIGIKERNLYAKDSAFKSMNIEDSGSGLLFRNNEIKGQRTLYLCEGELDKMSMDEAGVTNSIGNMMGANTFADEWKVLFDDCDELNILYDFDKNSLAGLQGIRKIMRSMPDKKIKIMDLPKFLEQNHPEDREVLLDEYSDVNDLWCANNICGMTKEKFKDNIDKSLITKSVEELTIIIDNFTKLHKEEKENFKGTFNLSFKSKIKSLNDFSTKIS